MLIRLIFGLSIVVLVSVFGLLSVVGIYSARSDSMRPALQPGDRFTVEKAAYGFSHLSLPFGLGQAFEPDRGFRWGSRIPERGDIVLYVANNRTHISRVIGLPGDRIGLDDGVILVNDVPIVREPVGEEELRLQSSQLAAFTVYRETLPNELVIEVYDAGESPGDNRPSTRVPPGHVFLISDNRDMAVDSRMPHPGGPGTVPIDAIIGRVRLD